MRIEDTIYLRHCASLEHSACGATGLPLCVAGDALRPLILHAFGGLYLDLDVVRRTGPCLGTQAHGLRTDPADMHYCMVRCNL